VQSTRKRDFPGIILLKKNSRTKSTSLWTTPVSVHRGPSVASGLSSSELGIPAKGQRTGRRGQGTR
jgi:hypothetical protein